MTRASIPFSTFILTISLFLCQLGNAAAIELNELANKIAFLSDGEVWVSDRDGQRITQITHTNGRIEDFLFSPTLKYLSYSQIIKYVDEPGLWEEGERIPQRAVCSIVIMELRDQKVLKEIMSPEVVGYILQNGYLMKSYYSMGLPVLMSGDSLSMIFKQEWKENYTTLKEASYQTPTFIKMDFLWHM